MELFKGFRVLHHLHLLIVEGLSVDGSDEWNDQNAHFVEQCAPNEDRHEPTEDKFVRLLWIKEDKSLHFILQVFVTYIFDAADGTQFDCQVYSEHPEAENEEQTDKLAPKEAIE